MRGVLESSRVAVGEQCAYGFEVRGQRGAVAWDFRRMGVLSTCLGEEYQNVGWQERFVGPGVGEVGAFQPGAGMAMGYDDLKVIEARDFLRSIAEGRSSGTELADAVRAAVTLDALVASAADQRWVDVPVG